MNSNFVETFTCQDGETYEIKTRLSWFEAQKVDQAGETLLFELDGDTFKSLADAREALEGRESEGGQGVLKCELRMDHAQKNFERLKARLVGLNPRQVLGIPATHAAQILRRIEIIEEEEKAAIREILAGNPTTTP